MKKLKLIIQKNPIFDKCPNCKEYATLHKSRSRKLREQIIKRLTFFKIYRCRNCGWRGYRSTLTLTMTSVKTFLIYILLALISAVIIRFIIAKFLIK